MECVVSIGMVLGHCGVYYISRTGTGTIADCVLSVGLVLGQ